MTNKEYHSHPAVSASDIKRLAQHPEEFAYNYGIEKEQSPALKFGSDFHDAMERLCKGQALESGFEEAERQAFGENPNRRKKDYQEWKALNEGLPTEQIVKMAKRLFSDFNKLFEIDYSLAIVEESFFADLNGFELKTRPDMIYGNTLVDWKTTKDIPTAGSMRRTVERYRYDLQAGFYALVLDILGYEISEFVFAFIRKSAPYQTGFISLSDLEKHKATAKDYILQAKKILAGDYDFEQQVYDFDLPF